MSRLLKFSPLVAVALLGACVTVPTGPSVLALPGSGKTFDTFRTDDAICRQYAYEQAGGVTAAQSAAQSGVGTAVVGTAVGAAAGALIGGSRGAGYGAGTGLVAGSLIGAGTASGSYYGAQQRFDNAYVQCMYAKGNRVPVAGGFAARSAAQPSTASPYPPPPAYPPPNQPPPPGFPPSTQPR